MTELAAGTQIPAETLDEIFAWFQFRQVCDNDCFQDYFNRQLKRIQRQYLLYLRNDMTTWDPMVVDYMERQIIADKTGTSSTTTTGEQSSTRNGTVKHETTGEDVTTSKGTSGNTRTLDTDVVTDGTMQASGADTVTEDSTRTDDLTKTRNLKDVRTDALKQTTSNAELTSEISDTRRLQGNTPDSATYGTGSSQSLAPPAEGMPAVDHASGAPATLNWTYTGAQEEQLGTGDRTSQSQGETDNSGTVTSEGTGDEKETGTVANEGTRNTQYGRKDTEHSSVSQGGTIEDAGSTTGEQTTKYGRTLTDTNELTDSQTSNGTSKGDSSEVMNHKERYSGRHLAPPELLRKAQEYIVSSNSLAWLIDNLETCFFQIYEAW